MEDSLLVSIDKPITRSGAPWRTCHRKLLGTKVYSKVFPRNYKFFSGFCAITSIGVYEDAQITQMYVQAAILSSWSFVLDS